MPFGSVSRLATWPAISERHKISGVNFVSHTSQNIQYPQNCHKSPQTSEQSRICETQENHGSDLTKHKESNISVPLTSTTGVPDLWWHERDQSNINQMGLMLWLTGLYIYFIHLRAVDWNAKPVASIRPTLQMLILRSIRCFMCTGSLWMWEFCAELHDSTENCGSKLGTKIVFTIIWKRITRNKHSDVQKSYRSLLASLL